MRWPKTVPLQVNILTLFLVVLIFVIGTVVVHGYARNKEAALDAAAALLDEVGTKIFERLRGVVDPAFAATNLATELIGVSTPPDMAVHPMASFLIAFLEKRPAIRSAYMGYANGTFYMIKAVAGDEHAGECARMGLPEETAFVVYRHIIRADGRRFVLRTYLDKQRRIVGSRFIRDPAFDARTRDWYRSALLTSAAVLTGPYVYVGNKRPGVTVSRRFSGQTVGVFGVDIDLAALAEFLASQRFSASARLFLFRADGTISVHPDMERTVKSADEDVGGGIERRDFEEFGDPVASALYEAFKTTGASGFEREIFEADEREFVARVMPLPALYGGGGYLAIAVPIEEFVAPVLAAGTEGVIFAGVVLVLFLPIVIWVARQVSRPLVRLAEEANDIRQFKLDEPLELQSHITEVAELRDSMAAMKGTLGSFTKYIPSALVRSMIQTGLRPELGGARQQITLMFTDIAGFTTLADGMSPETLMRQTSEYFTALGSVILESGGTIDKYIGDAVMAFWNAPQPDPDHALHACLAALRCARRVDALNAGWTAAGAPPMPTRFGLHTGEAVVGHVGSSDRMDFTAIGAAVNLASRLEALNKHFGTTILISADAAGPNRERFVLRHLGKVIPKGALKASEILELVGTRPDGNGDDAALEASEGDIDYCTRWNALFERYLARDWAAAADGFAEFAAERPDDRAAAFYADRARHYGTTAPATDWDGTEAFETK